MRECKAGVKDETLRGAKMQKERRVGGWKHFEPLILDTTCGSHEKKTKSAHHTHRWLPNPTQMSKGLMTAEHLWKRAARGETLWVYRWLYLQRDDGEPITNISVSSYFQGQNNLCVLKQLHTLRSHLFRIGVFFVFAVIKYRRVQNKHFCLLIKSFKLLFQAEKRNDVKTLFTIRCIKANKPPEMDQNVGWLINQRSLQ